MLFGQAGDANQDAGGQLTFALPSFLGSIAFSVRIVGIGCPP